jgi:hypothetical protein
VLCESDRPRSVMVHFKVMKALIIFVQNFCSKKCGTQLDNVYVRSEVHTAVNMKKVVFLDMKPQFVPHRRLITSPLQSPAS